MLTEELSIEYKKASERDVQIVNADTAKIALELELADRMEIIRRNEVFFTVKDHKSGFRKSVMSTVKRRLLNPAKTDLGVVSKHILQEKIEYIKQTMYNLTE